jgi:small subunit ribosomal protein S13
LARIAGIDLPREKQVEIALTYIYGVGRTSARKACVGASVDPITKVRDLTDEEVVRLREFIDANFQIEGDLRRERSQNIKRLMEIGCYCGIAAGFPYAGSALTPTLGPAKGRGRRWVSRRSSGSSRPAVNKVSKEERECPGQVKASREAVRK